MSVFQADSSADTIDEATLFATPSGAIAVLPDGYLDLGYMTDAGAQWARALTVSDVTSVQSLAPTRTDPTADTITLTVQCQETKLATIGLGTGAATSGITAATNGVVRVDKPAIPGTRHYRILAIGEDDTDDGPIYFCRYLPNARVTGYGAQNQEKSDTPTLWEVTLQGYVDNTVGTDHSWIWGGEGWKALKATMGFA
jgi:hypothetical protein